MKSVMGCDIGSLTSKAVVMKGKRILASTIISSKARPEASADAVIEEVLAKAKLDRKDIDFCVGTGYGRKKVPVVDKTISEIVCHGKGARWMLPSAKTIIDIGGQDCKAIRLDDEGNVDKFVANDKCASGTGRFLEVMADLLHVSVDELGELSEKATQSFTMSSACTLWGQAEVVKRLNSGYKVPDIASAINTSMATRASILASSVGVEDDVLMTGGVAKNKGVLADLENILGHRIKKIRKADPQLAGAIGAAVVANETLSKKEAKK